MEGTPGVKASGLRLSAMAPSLRKSRVAASVCAGAITGLLTILFSFSFSALIFDGPLEPWSTYGFGMALLSAVVIGIAVAMGSSLPWSIAILQDRTAPIFGLMAASITAAMVTAPPERVFLTACCAIFVATIGTGILLGGVGLLRAGNLVRFVPMPVIGGFVAGSGWLLITGAIRVMTREDGTWSHLSELFSLPRLLDWAPGALFGT